MIFCAGRRNLSPVIFETPTWFGDPRLFCRIASKRAFSRTAEKFFSELGPGDEYSERCCFSYLCGGLNAGTRSRVWRGKDPARSKRPVLFLASRGACATLEPQRQGKQGSR